MQEDTQGRNRVRLRVECGDMRFKPIGKNIFIIKCCLNECFFVQTQHFWIILEKNRKKLVDKCCVYFSLE